MKKPKNKIKEMLIFPYNFSALKKFQNNFIHKNNNNNKNNNINNMSLSSKNIFNKNNINNNSNKTKSNRTFIKSEIDLSNKKFSLEKNKYNTGRNKAKINDKEKNIKNRPFSETRIKINIGIIKEICFMNNNNI
jgi:type V secretory pathway adhesin AidA